MTTREQDRMRADICYADALDGFAPQDWSAATAPKPRIPAEATGFVSQQPTGGAGQGGAVPLLAAVALRCDPTLPFTPVAPTSDDQPRRRRTGRNVQLNLKARPDTIDAHCAVADATGWGLAEALDTPWCCCRANTAPGAADLCPQRK